MSAFEGIANIAETPQNVRFWPKADIDLDVEGCPLLGVKRTSKF